MGRVTVPASGLIYIDSCVLIYGIERVEPYFSCASALWPVEGARPQIITSALTLLEVLVKPFREKNDSLGQAYRESIMSPEGVQCIPITLPLLESAARIRAEFGLRTPDAIHTATAISSGCVLFVTNDVVFRRISGLNVAVISEISSA